MISAQNYSLIKRKLQSFVDLVIKRPVPHTLVSYRFLLPNQSFAVRAHRAVFLGSWNNLPRWLWLFIQLYSCSLWFLFHSWRLMAKAWRKHAVQTKMRFQVPLVKQAADLCALALLHGVPPGFYYRYGLFRKPPKSWLNYVYDHELPHWHTVMCGKVDAASAGRLLSDKKRFAEAMAHAGIPTVETRAFIPRGAPSGGAVLFTEQPLFCKPNASNRGRSAFALLYDPTAGRYRLVGEDIVEGEEAILHYFSRKTADQDYLLQPLLLNHPVVREMCGQSRLATIRVMTAHDGQKGVCVGAVFELPGPDDRDRWWLMPVDPINGQFLKPADSFIRSQQKGDLLPPDIAGRKLPFWDDTLKLCLRAHDLLSEVAAIGWDAALTPSGAILIEGNFNWRVAPLQLLSGIPLLETTIADAYASRLFPGRSPGRCTR